MNKDSRLSQDNHQATEEESTVAARPKPQAPIRRGRLFWTCPQCGNKNPGSAEACSVDGYVPDFVNEAAEDSAKPVELASIRGDAPELASIEPESELPNLEDTATDLEPLIVDSKAWEAEALRIDAADSEPEPLAIDTTEPESESVAIEGTGEVSELSTLESLSTEPESLVEEEHKTDITAQEENEPEGELPALLAERTQSSAPRHSVPSSSSLPSPETIISQQPANKSNLRIGFMLGALIAVMVTGFTLLFDSGDTDGTIRVSDMPRLETNESTVIATAEPTVAETKTEEPTAATEATEEAPAQPEATQPDTDTMVADTTEIESDPSVATAEAEAESETVEVIENGENSNALKTLDIVKAIDPDSLETGVARKRTAMKQEVEDLLKVHGFRSVEVSVSGNNIITLKGAFSDSDTKDVVLALVRNHDGVGQVKDKLFLFD